MTHEVPPVSTSVPPVSMSVPLMALAPHQESLHVALREAAC
jgi:hypothetical protein